VRARLPAAAAVDVAERADLRDGGRAGRLGAGPGQAGAARASGQGDERVRGRSLQGADPGEVRGGGQPLLLDRPPVGRRRDRAPGPSPSVSPPPSTPHPDPLRRLQEVAGAPPVPRAAASRCPPSRAAARVPSPAPRCSRWRSTGTSTCSPARRWPSASSADPRPAIIAFSLWGGIVADRADHKKVMLIAQSVMAALADPWPVLDLGPRDPLRAVRPERAPGAASAFDPPGPPGPRPAARASRPARRARAEPPMFRRPHRQLTWPG
jgi:hypothetical protein